MNLIDFSRFSYCLICLVLICDVIILCLGKRWWYQGCEKDFRPEASR